MKKLLLFVLVLPLMGKAQDRPLAIFDPLMGKTWSADGQWGDGSKFVQRIAFEYGLDSAIVIARSTGFVDEAQTKMGDRNHGIRKVDKATGEIRFWEFDVFGELTTGKVFGEGRDLFYQYEYGGYALTDRWEYVNDTTYRFKVGVYEEGKWSQVYLETLFVATEK